MRRALQQFSRLGDAIAARGLRQSVTGPDATRRLKLAVVSDHFTALGIAPEADVVFLDPRTWRWQLQSRPPHLLLVESCWHGRQGEWRGLVAGDGAVIARLVRFCRSAGIPTVFWAKEDPVHLEDFLGTARHFDHVLTTDAESVPRYMSEFGHDRVDVMTFPVQPRLHHPLHSGARQPGAMFAGAWYGNFTTRCEWFCELADGLLEAGPFHVFRRPGPPEIGDYPARYANMLRPTVDYSRMGEVYRAYQAGLTINTVVDSPTMFARRAVELLACGVRVFSNPCRALGELFPDHIQQFHDRDAIRSAATRLYAEGEGTENQLKRLLGLRAVMASHTWHARLGDVRQTVFGQARGPLDVVVLAAVDDSEQMARLAEFIDTQQGVNARALVAAPPGLEGRGRVRVRAKYQLVERSAEIADGDALVAFWHADDWYGPHYLQDLALAAFHYAGDAVGKGSWYRFGAGGLEQTGGAQPYTTTGPIPLRRAMVRARLLPARLDQVFQQIPDGAAVECAHAALDVFSYVEGGAGARLPVFMHAL